MAWTMQVSCSQRVRCRRSVASRTAGLILAAGAGTRFGQPKAPVMIDGQRLVDRAVDVLHGAGCDPVLVVLGAWVGEVPGAATVVNEGWATGMASSLRVGLAELTERTEIDRVMVTLVDLPGLTVAAAQRVATSASPLVTAVYQGRPGHPVAFDRSQWSAVSDSVSGDQGARRYLETHSDQVDQIEVGDIASAEDIDEPPMRLRARS